MAQDDPWGLMAFTDGLAAGQKFRLLQEELKSAQLQRLDFEHSAAYRSQRRELDLALLTSQKQRADLDLSLGEIEKQKATFLQQSLVADRPGEVAGKAAGVEFAQAQAAGAKASNTYQAEDRGYTKQRQRQSLAEGDATLAKAETDQTSSSLDLAGRLATAAGSSRRSFTPADALASVKGLGIKGGPAAEATMAQYLYDHAQALQDQLTRTQTENDSVIAERQANAQRDASATVGQSLINATSLAQLEIQAPGSIDAYATGDHDPHVASLARAIASGGGKDQKLSPGATKESEVLGKSLGTMQDLLAADETRLAELEGGAEPSSSFKRFDSSVATERKSEQTALERSIKARKATMEKLKKALDDQYAEQKKAKPSGGGIINNKRVSRDESIPDLSGKPDAVAKLKSGQQYYWYGKLARKN